jgi:hypothetical protein
VGWESVKIPFPFHLQGRNESDKARTLQVAKQSDPDQTAAADRQML